MTISFRAGAAMLGALVAASCAAGSGAGEEGGMLDTLVAARAAPPADRFEVWVCEVPAGVTDPVFAASDERVALTADAVVERIGTRVPAYFAAVSHGAYRPSFHPGGIVTIAARDTSEACISNALARSSRDADAVLVVATAEHAADQPGGRATPGTWLSCTDDCSAAATRRSVYVGANDFHPAHGAAMPFDLIEHEIGHSLGLPHSGDAVGTAGNRGVGPYDLMADPATPRAADPARRDGPDLLAIDRVGLGWLTADDVVVAGDDRSGIELAPSTGATGTRLLVVPLDDHRLLTVELLVDRGFDDHLARDGVVVHLVSDAPALCGAVTRCTGVDRVQQIVTIDGRDDALLGAGDSVTHAAWRVSVDAVTPGAATVSVGRGPNDSELTRVAASRADASH